MTENAVETRAPLSLEEVAQAVLELAQERSLEGFVTRFLEKVRAWAAPSGVLAAARDSAAESGWRLLPALSTGSGPLGAERLIRQFLDELPEGLARPSLVRPAHATAGVRMRGNCLAPWSCEGESGVLVLRGVADPAPPNLADAIALLSVPVWPRLLGGPAARVEASVAELRRLADRLRDDADRQVERLQAARTPVVAEPQAADPVAARRLAELEEKLAVASAEAERLSALGDALRSEGLAVSARLVEERRAAAEAGASAQAARESLTVAREGLAEAEERAAALALEREELRQQVAALEKALVEAEEERDVARVARAAEPAPGTGESEDVLRRTLVVLRRTPYLPPPLRIAAQEAEAAVGAKHERPWARIALLDRDSAGLESLAAELEAEGLDVRIASHPEELALLLKTPEGRELDAAICDVLAFRPDQTVAGVFRGWEKDRPGLALHLSFSRDSPAEVERAQRIPLSLTKGRFQRPLNRLELMEILEPLRRRSS